MKVVAVIDDEDTVYKSLQRLGLLAPEESRAPPAPAAASPAVPRPRRRPRPPPISANLPRSQASSMPSHATSSPTPQPGTAPIPQARNSLHSPTPTPGALPTTATTAPTPNPRTSRRLPSSSRSPRPRARTPAPSLRPPLSQGCRGERRSQRRCAICAIAALDSPSQLRVQLGHAPAATGVPSRTLRFTNQNRLRDFLIVILRSEHVVSAALFVNAIRSRGIEIAFHRMAGPRRTFEDIGSSPAIKDLAIM